MQHELKTWPEYFWAVVKREKTFEIRVNDRDYQTGDTLILREYDPIMQSYTGNGAIADVTYILDETDRFIPDGIVVMSIKTRRGSVDEMRWRQDVL
jgi:hypothetical protein